MSGYSETTLASPSWNKPQREVRAASVGPQPLQAGLN